MSIYDAKINTLEGGELLSSDADRLKLHGQADHYKTFGRDFFDFFESLNGTLAEANIPVESRQRLRASTDVVYVFRKN